MTDQEFYTNVGYLANPIRETNIEAEMHPRRQQSFITDYASWTNNYPLPTNTTVRPYYIWDEDTNKYGLELRVYFVSNENMPQSLYNMLEPRKVQNRPGYENWKRRISINGNITPLLQVGFVLGTPQDENRIRALIPAQFVNDFNHGYNL
ncbi:hypothetical protein EZS27_010021 [termite gut metagenome]|uniref:Uncharacterized protein n=1 Tax=termite gut metagenome TaxID=433724 RepID=A0A5J4SAF0_9ZZZZ